MSQRSRQPHRNILQTIIDEKGDDWGQSTHQVARSDADRILEALVASLGVDACVAALDEHGLEGKAYRYLLTPLHAEASSRRRAIRNPDTNHTPGD